MKTIKKKILFVVRRIHEVILGCETLRSYAFSKKIFFFSFQPLESYFYAPKLGSDPFWEPSTQRRSVNFVKWCPFLTNFSFLPFFIFDDLVVRLMISHKSTRILLPSIAVVWVSDALITIPFFKGWFFRTRRTEFE